MAESAQDFVLKLLLEKGPLPGGASPAGYRYLDAGHIDSLGLIKFVFRIEDRFGIRIGPEDIESEAFRTVGGLAQLIDRRVETGRA